MWVGRTLLGTALIGAVAAAVLFGFEHRVRDLAALLFPAVFAALYVLGFREDMSFAGPPARWIGASGTWVCLALFTRPDSWGFAGTIDGEIRALDLGASALGVLLFGGVAVWGALRFARSRHWHRALLAATPLAVLPGLGLMYVGQAKRGAATWMSAYALVTLALFGLAALRTARRGR
jgi:hypothetical protein